VKIEIVFFSDRKESPVRKLAFIGTMALIVGSGMIFPLGLGHAVDDFVKSFGEPIDTLIKEGLQSFYTYHKDPALLDRSTEKFLEVLKIAPDNDDALWLVSRNYFKMGDNAGEETEKLKYYAMAEEWADKCLAASPESIGGHFWKMAAMGRAGEIKGLVTSALKLSALKKEIQYILDHAAPSHEFHLLAINTRADLLLKSPWFAGGDVKESARLYKQCIDANPRITLFYVNLAENYIKQKRYKEGRELLMKVKNFDKEPFYIWDTVLYDLPRVDRLLKEIEGK